MTDDADTAPEKTTKQLNIRVPAPMGDQIDTIARRERNSAASVCRRLIAASLDREFPKLAPR